MKGSGDWSPGRVSGAPPLNVPHSLAYKKTTGKPVVFLCVNYLPSSLSSMSHTPSMYMMPSARS